MKNNPHYPRKLHHVQGELDRRRHTIEAFLSLTFESRKKAEGFWERLWQWFRRH